MSAVCRNSFPSGLCSADEQATIAQQVLPNSLKAPRASRLERRDHVALEEVGSGGERDGVGDLGFQIIGLCFNQVEGFVDGDGAGLYEQLNESFDCGNGHGEVGVVGDEATVRCYYARGD